MKLKKTYRLEEETISELEKLANDGGVTATQALERAIHSAANSSGKSTVEPDAAKAASRQQSKELAALVRQLDAKDEQIAALLGQLAAAQEVSAAVAETAKAAQALHAAAVGGELAPAGGKPGRWARLKAAWRG